MAKDIDVIKVVTHTDGGEEYSHNLSRYLSNGDSVAVRGYGVDENDPATAQMQFDAAAKYHGNDGKNQYIQLIISFLRDTAPDAETAMAITDKALEPLKDNHMMLIGCDHKPREKSDYHTHTAICTTDLETGKLLHPTNAVNYPIAQNIADIIQKPVQLVIERKNPPQDGDEDAAFKRVFYPHIKPED